MNRIYIGDPVDLELPLDVKALMISTITAASIPKAPPMKKQKRKKKRQKMKPQPATISLGGGLFGGLSGISASELDTLLRHVKNYPVFPVVTAALHPGLKARVSIISYSIEKVYYNVVLEISMPLQSVEESAFEHASLLWMPWAAHQTKPVDVPGRYHLIQMPNFSFYQARETICLDYPYYFSGQEHPKEDTTPPEITALYAETNAMFDRRKPSQRLNMTYINRYRHGRHCINEHSDEVGAYGSNLDVCCFITGPASREAVFRVRTHGKQIQDHMKSLCVDPSNALATREIVRVKIPAGLYVMHGQQFQFRFSHEFPELHPEMYASVIDGVSRDKKHFADFPSRVAKTAEGADRSHIVQAQYVADHAALVEAQMHRLKRSGVSVERERENFREWCLVRTSYTQRCFNAQKSREISVQEELKREGKPLKRNRKKKKKRKKI